jgi:hypothetical protein
MKTEYTKKLNENALKELNGDNEKERESDKESWTVDKASKEVMNNIPVYESVRGGRRFINRDLIAGKLGLSIEKARIVKSIVENMTKN